ncbi:hypothetical protein B6V75_00240 [Thioclava sp. F1Mire-8]|uniref:ABC-three component system protein n=1 Tax=Thioclava sp. F1Mire-8 TaxID=1973006 RepID=UPI000B54230F|nr:ABC-three component system protein [Thioclava sp. F1Mire-8]OWY04622.1 hypothetical protein B6V75_00240 [Thioclava sp. F1Mire-8]
MAFDEHRLIDSLNDSELEDLIKKWLGRLNVEYVGFERPTGSADMGRDAVGFLTPRRYDGAWHNYQCKHLKKPLGIRDFTVELGKIFHYACAGEFTVPEKYIFVAPKSGVRDVKKLIDRPSNIASFLKENWEKYCLAGIATEKCPLTAFIRKAIDEYDFEKVELWKSTELVELPHMRAVLHDHMDIDPGEAPRILPEDVPDAITDTELHYVSQLIEVFREAANFEFSGYDDVIADSMYGPQLQLARQRYLEREAFRRHFRDNLPLTHLDGVDIDVHSTIVDRYHALHQSPRYQRLSEIMTLATSAQITGPLGRHNRVTPSVKQGVCHHFANIKKLPWA